MEFMGKKIQWWAQNQVASTRIHQTGTLISSQSKALGISSAEIIGGKLRR